MTSHTLSIVPKSLRKKVTPPKATMMLGGLLLIMPVCYGILFWLAL